MTKKSNTILTILEPFTESACKEWWSLWYYLGEGYLIAPTTKHWTTLRLFCRPAALQSLAILPVLLRLLCCKAASHTKRAPCRTSNYLANFVQCLIAGTYFAVAKSGGADKNGDMQYMQTSLYEKEGDANTILQLCGGLLYASSCAIFIPASHDEKNYTERSYASTVRKY